MHFVVMIHLPHLPVLRHSHPSKMLKDILNIHLSYCSYFLRQPTLSSAMASEMANRGWWCFLFFQDNFYFSRLFSSFCRLIFTFSDYEMSLQSLVLSLTGDISGCLWFLGTQLYFKDAYCTFQRCFWFPDLVLRLTVPRLADIFSCSVIFPF